MRAFDNLIYKIKRKIKDYKNERIVRKMIPKKYFDDSRHIGTFQYLAIGATTLSAAKVEGYKELRAKWGELWEHLPIMYRHKILSELIKETQTLQQAERSK